MHAMRNRLIYDKYAVLEEYRDMVDVDIKDNAIYCLQDEKLKA